MGFWSQMETPLSLIILEILGVAAILYLIGSLRVLRQYERGVVFLLGKFEGVRGPGLTLIFLPIQQMVRVSLRTVTMQIPSQKIITKDNVSIDIAAVAYYHISDPEKAVIVIENVYNAINQIARPVGRRGVSSLDLSLERSMHGGPSLTGSLLSPASALGAACSSISARVSLRRFVSAHLEPPGVVFG